MFYLAIALPSVLQGQLPRIELGPPVAAHDSGFSGITSARILSDGRVLVSEFDERRLILLDMRASTVRQVGRRGQGPGEYAMTPMLYALGGDTTLATVRSQRRWLLLQQDGILGMVPPDDSQIIATRGSILDASPRFIAFSQDLPPRSDGIVDSADLYLIDRASRRTERIARLRIAPVRVAQSRDAGGRAVESSEIVGAVRSSERVVLCPDGWIAILRTDPARIDWRSPDGTVTETQAVPLPPTQLDARQRAWYAKTFSLGSRAGGGGPVGWPSTIPLLSGPAVALPGSKLAVLRNRDAGADYPRYLIVERMGRITGQMDLKPGQRILAASDAGLLVLSADQDGLQHLSLHRLP